MSSSSKYEIVKTVDGTWMVLVDGIQWGAGPRDKSGCSSQTWPTRKEAAAAIVGAALEEAYPWGYRSTDSEP